MQDMYGIALRSLIVFILIPNLLFGNDFNKLVDTIPPEIITFPEDLTIPCGVPYQQQFDTWLENHAGLAVSDDGQVEFFHTFNEDLESQIESSSDTLCGNTAMIPIGFYAVDDCLNVSDTAYANFIIQDIAQPLIVTAAQSLELQCDIGIVDSLQQWLDNIGGAIANEVCGGDIIWNNYIWNDNLGNSGFALVSDTTNIEIIRNTCDWNVDVSFFVLDECGNANVTTSSFSIIDTISPIITNLLTDTLIACVDTIPNVTPIFLDGCEGVLEIETTTESTQGGDPNLCDYYNYTVTSSYSASDICGNIGMTNQIVEVKDTLAPIIVANQNISIDCDENLSLISTYIDRIIDCAPVETNFQDSILTENVCNSSFQRDWTFVDVCGNESSYVQFINIIDQTGPQITNSIPELVFECSNITALDQSLLSFLDLLPNLETQDNCGTAKIFIKENLDPDSIIFNYQFIPQTLCNNQPLLEHQLIPISIIDDCGNKTEANSSISLVDTIAPSIINCMEELNFDLENGACELEFPLQNLEATGHCDTIRSHYLFKRVIVLDSFTAETENLRFQWDFTAGDAEAIIEGAIVQINTQGFLNDNLGLDFRVSDGSSNELFSYSEPLSFCDEQTLQFEVDLDFTKQWIDQGHILLDLEYQITEIFDCLESSEVGFTIIIPNLIVNPIKYFYVLDQQEERSYIPGDTINIGTGQHHLSYIVQDCGGHRDTCLQVLNIKDLELPELICPDDFGIILPNDTCFVDLALNPDFQFIENCNSDFNFVQTLPEGNDRFMQFTEQDEGQIVADNLQINFQDINLDNIILNPVLIVELLANTSADNGFFSIRDEDGNILANTPQSIESCITPQRITIDLSLEQLTDWNADGEIKFNFVNTDINLDGIAPCSLLDFNGQTDMSSFLTASLAFTEVIPGIVVTNISNGDTININNGNISFSAGSFNVELTSSDNSGNIASCNYIIDVHDNSSPALDCRDVEIEVDINNDSGITIDLSMLDFELFDNCDSVSVEIEAPVVNCADIGSELLASLNVQDQFGNDNTCTFLLKPISATLNPQFSSSLCGGDTLTLLNNIDGNLELEYFWTGPAGFNSNEPNPKIENVSADNSGIYFLEVIKDNGCVFNGNVEVIIEALGNPIIESNKDVICLGDPLMLSSNSYSDEVIYLWYEGIAPNGVLVGTSTDPELTITPGFGTHFYYSIVDGNGCQSDASNAYMIEVINFPEALVENSFITACEGESVSLNTENINPTLDFLWTGPNGYQSNEANPPSLQNIGFDQQGSYQLVVSDRGCESEPAISELIIFNTPEKPTLIGDNILCEGSALSLTVSNNVASDKYTWFLDGVLYTTSNTNSLIIPDAQTQLGGNWTVVVEDDNCVSPESDIFVIEIEAEITLGANNNGPICEGGSVNLMASFIPDASYNWTTPNNLEFFGRVVNVPAVNGVYSVEVTTVAGCIGVATTVVEIIPVPEVTALSNNSGDCMNIGDPISFFPSIFPPGGYQYLWTGPNSFASNEEILIIPYQGQSSNGQYGLQIQNDNCISDIVYTNIDAVIIPEQPVIAQNGISCFGASINILASNVSDEVDEYIWNTPIGQLITDEPALNISPSSNANIGFYTLTVIIDGCMSQASESLLIELEEELDIPIIIGPSSLCEGQELLLEIDNFQNDIEYIWTIPNGSSIQANTLSIDNFNFGEVGNYFVQAVSSICESEISDAFFVDLSNGPATPTLNNSSFAFCQDQISNISLTDFIESPIEGDFHLYDFMGQLVASTTDGNFTNLDLSNFNIGTLLFTITQSIMGCESEGAASLTITIEEESQAANFLSEQIFICEFGETNISFSNPDNLDLNFSVIGSNVSLENIATNQISILVFDIGETEILMTSTQENCGIIGSQSIIISYVDEIEANDDEYTIIGASNIMLPILDNDKLFGDVIINIENIIGGPKFEVIDDMIEVNTNNLTGIFNVQYSICDTNCPEICDDATITINIDQNNGGDACKPFNVMTPNGDGVNDVFIIPCIRDGDLVNIKIFNSFGALVFAQEDYQNNWMAKRDGEDLPDGTYYYFMSMNAEITMAGFLIIER